MELNAKNLVAEAKVAGLVFVRCGSLNVGARGLRGTPAFILTQARKHGYASDPFGNSACLFTKYDIARKLGYPV